ncbi:MAG: hypothetical protein EOO05_14260 [Chitinophagaceae bacterium]|nr:MAG: hypothetical protein EOO05_14260 [Chitinophagaceae bacterium]
MKKYVPLISLSLIICLVIYVFYRSDKTVINQMVIALVSRDSYHHWKTIICDLLPLQDYFIYSLPEGLWVFCITITSSFFRINFLWYRVEAAVFPLTLAFGMELCQLLHICNGRFDWVDLLFSFVFWWVAFHFTEAGPEKRSLRLRASFNSLSCLFSYSIVYLAHVIN